ncbi:hypothetical protein ERHA54_34950 [Erwinia rhapontici]|uniref:hypothetical protein n=1 Tax=Erwinia rhapontici TaxID=55212 RepID=UPI001BB3EE7D|nr:hypothetical protein [Erwinia rhapontici]BCQ40892.1 hypothetical protein ERHA54_34950 [Erwinia rhapontici]
MPVIPDDFLDLAIKHDDACDEMQLRNSVSRAYYAGYLHIIQRINESKILLSGTPAGMHDKLINSLNANMCGALCGGMTPSKQLELAGMLKIVKQLRTKADYKLNDTVNQSDKDTAIDMAADIIRFLP